MTTRRCCTFSCHSRPSCHSCRSCHSCLSRESCHSCDSHQIVEDEKMPAIHQFPNNSNCVMQVLSQTFHRAGCAFLLSTSKYRVFLLPSMMSVNSNWSACMFKIISIWYLSWSLPVVELQNEHAPIPWSFWPCCNVFYVNSYKIVRLWTIFFVLPWFHWDYWYRLSVSHWSTIELYLSSVLFLRPLLSNDHTVIVFFRVSLL